MPDAPPGSGHDARPLRCRHLLLRPSAQPRLQVHMERHHATTDLLLREVSRQSTAPRAISSRLTMESPCLWRSEGVVDTATHAAADACRRTRPSHAHHHLARGAAPHPFLIPPPCVHPSHRRQSVRWSVPAFDQSILQPVSTQCAAPLSYYAYACDASFGRAPSPRRSSPGRRTRGDRW